MDLQKLNNLKYAATLSVAISLLYEVAYFWGMGISIAATPLSAIDYVRGWMEWGTYCISFFMGIASFALMSKVIHKASNEKVENRNELNVAQKGDDYEDVSEFADKALKYFSYCTLIIVFLFGEWFLNISLIGFVYIAIKVFVWVSGDSSEVDRKNQTMLLAIFVGLIYIFIMGFTNGGRALNSSYQEMGAIIKIQENEKIKLVRYFDSWMLSKNESNKFAWINNQSQARVEFVANRSQLIGLLCLYKRDYQFARNWELHHCENLYPIVFSHKQ